MLVAAQEMEAQYIVRSLQGKMRIGLAESTMLVALAHAMVLSRGDAGEALPKGEALQEELGEAERIIKQVYCEMPNYEVIVPALLQHGLHELPNHASLTAGIPVKPMLAKPTKGISEVLDRFSSGRFTCEYKYDGERAQIHLLRTARSIFSRNSEDNLDQVPRHRRADARRSRRHGTSRSSTRRRSRVDTARAPSSRFRCCPRASARRRPSTRSR